MNYLKTLMISVVITLNVILNSLVIAVFTKYPQLREDRTNMFMFSLTLSDLITGITLMPISAALCSLSLSSAGQSVRYLVTIQLICMKWCGFTSLHSLCWVTVCKMVAILKPLQYEQLFNKARSYTIIAFIWLTGGLLAIIGIRVGVTWNDVLCLPEPLAESDSDSVVRMIFMVSLAIALTGIVFSTSRIFCSIVRTHLQITTQVQSIGGNNVEAGVTPSATVTSIRSGKNVLIICAGILVLTIPVIIYGVGVLMWGFHNVSSSYGFVACWIAMCNSFVNGLLYLVLFRSMRQKAAKLLKGCLDLCRLTTHQ